MARSAPQNLHKLHTGVDKQYLNHNPRQTSPQGMARTNSQQTIIRQGSPTTAKSVGGFHNSYVSCEVKKRPVSVPNVLKRPPVRGSVYAQIRRKLGLSMYRFVTISYG